MNPGSYDDLDTRIKSCPESVALFTDTQLATFVKQVQGNGVARRCVIAEVLLRYWLYEHRPESIETAAKDVLEEAHVQRLREAFTGPVIDLRRERCWPIPYEVISNAFVIPDLKGEEEELWKFLRRRISSFVECAGVIPAYIKGTAEAVAIPFIIERDHDEGQILDREGHQIEGWIEEAQAIWKVLDWQCCVRLNCDFGNYKLYNGPPFDGGSFALPVLFALTRSESATRHPLGVICTGALRDGKLADIDGRDAKQQLARQIGARFIAPGVGDSNFIAPDLDVRKVLKLVLEVAGESEAALKNVFIDHGLGRFGDTIKRLASKFIGREQKLRQLLQWIDRSDCATKARQRWIGGEAGCGKSAFIAKLIQESKEFGGWFVIPYFFDPISNPNPRRTVEEFFDFAAKQIAAEHGFSFDKVERGAGEQARRLNYALEMVRKNYTKRIVFLVDGVDEVEGSLDALASVAAENAGCLWVIAGQDIPETLSVRSIAGIEHDSLPPLLESELSLMIERSGVELTPREIATIIEKAERSPQYVRWVIDDLLLDRLNVDLTTLPRGLHGYYRHIIDRYRTGGTIGDRWRGDLVDILALLATTKHAVPVSAATVAALLGRYARSYSESAMSAALQACRPILASVVPHEGGNELWTISKNCFREFIVCDPEFTDVINSARNAWAEACLAWDSDLESGLRAYALRNVGDELWTQEDKAPFIALARSEKFISDQVNILSPSIALETLARGIETALSTGRLADSAALTLKRSKLVEDVYSGSPFRAMQSTNHRWAQELIARIENQNDRTLWYLALAVWHSNGGRFALARDVLDEAIPRTALRERLTEGASMCAAVLLSLLTHIKTHRFDWQRFLSRLDDASKTELTALLVCHIRPPLEVVRQVIESIDDKVRANAQKEVVRELARVDVASAEQEVAKFTSEFNRAFAATEIAAAYARMRRFDDIDHIMTRYMPQHAVRQKAKALAYKAAALTQVKRSKDADAARAEARQLIEEQLRSEPAQRARAYCEVGQAEAEMGFTRKAMQAFQCAKDAISQLPARKHIVRAICFKSLASNVASVVERDFDFIPLLEKAVEDALQEIQLSGDPKADRMPLLLLRVLARNGQLTLAATVLQSMKPKPGEQLNDARRATYQEALARLNAYHIRFKRWPAEPLTPKGFDREGTMLFHAFAAIEKVKQSCAENVQPVTALREVVFGLRYSKPNVGAKRWGPARVLMEAARFLFNDDQMCANRVFDEAKAYLDQMKSYRGRYLVEFARRRAEAGQRDAAQELLRSARTCSRKQMNDSEKFDLLAEIERAELDLNLATETDFEEDGVLHKLDLIPNDANTVSHKLNLATKILVAFAAARRYRELNAVCDFAFERLQDNRFFKLPERESAERRSVLAAEFAGKLAKAAIEQRFAPNWPQPERSTAAGATSIREWTEKFLATCEQIEKEEAVRLPADGVRARALLLACDEHIDEAFSAANRVAVGPTRSVIFRDLAKWAVHAGRLEQAMGMLPEITYKRSEHLADIGREIANRGATADAPYLQQIVILCSEFPDAAYRIIESLIRFYKPAPGELVAILEACGLWNTATEGANGHK